MDAGPGSPVGGPESAGAAAHVFVDDVEAPILCVADHHHLRRVLRLGPGQPVTAADGEGRWRLCCIDDSDAGLDPVGDLLSVPRETTEVTVAFAPTKGDRPEWAVQKLTEVGVDRIVVFMAARSVVRWAGERAEAQVARLGRVAREASMQSRRAWLPEVVWAESFADAADGSGTAGGGAGGGAVLAERGGDPPSLDRAWVLVGPEGGWDEGELGAGLGRVSLGPRVLRTETAAVAAGSLLCGLRAGLVRPWQ